MSSDVHSTAIELPDGQDLLSTFFHSCYWFCTSAPRGPLEWSPGLPEYYSTVLLLQYCASLSLLPSASSFLEHCQFHLLWSAALTRFKRIHGISFYRDCKRCSVHSFSFNIVSIFLLNCSDFASETSSDLIHWRWALSVWVNGTHSQVNPPGLSS